jgi:hypothetical protein
VDHCLCCHLLCSCDDQICEMHLPSLSNSILPRLLETMTKTTSMPDMLHSIRSTQPVRTFSYWSCAWTSSLDSIFKQGSILCSSSIALSFAADSLTIVQRARNLESSMPELQLAQSGKQLTGTSPQDLPSFLAFFP